MIGKTVVVTTRHACGVEGAKARFVERFSLLRWTFRTFIGSADATWSANYCRVSVGTLGLTVAALCEVQDEELKILVKLPFPLSGLAGPIESFLQSHGDMLKAEPAPDDPKPMMVPLGYHHQLLLVYRRLLGLTSRQVPAHACTQPAAA